MIDRATLEEVKERIATLKRKKDENASTPVYDLQAKVNEAIEKENEKKMKRKEKKKKKREEIKNEEIKDNDEDVAALMGFGAFGTSKQS